MPKEEGNGKGIGWAVHAMQNGAKVRRATWRGGRYISIHGQPDSTNPVISTHMGVDVDPWYPDHSDLLARDWESVE